MKRMKKAKQETLWKKHINKEVLARLFECAFSLVFMLKYEPGEKGRLGKVRGQLASDYSRLFGQVMDGQVMDQLVFCLAYLTHMTFYQHFPQDRPHFDLRFILDCYHIVLAEVNGVLISDYYV